MPWSSRVSPPSCSSRSCERRMERKRRDDHVERWRERSARLIGADVPHNMEAGAHGGGARSPRAIQPPPHLRVPLAPWRRPDRERRPRHKPRRRVADVPGVRRLVPGDGRRRRRAQRELGGGRQCRATHPANRVVEPRYRSHPRHFSSRRHLRQGRKPSRLEALFLCQARGPFRGPVFGNVTRGRPELTTISAWIRRRGSG